MTWENIRYNSDRKKGHFGSFSRILCAARHNSVFFLTNTVVETTEEKYSGAHYCTYV